MPAASRNALVSRLQIRLKIELSEGEKGFVYIIPIYIYTSSKFSIPKSIKIVMVRKKVYGKGKSVVKATLKSYPEIVPIDEE